MQIRQLLGAMRPTFVRKNLQDIFELLVEFDDVLFELQQCTINYMKTNTEEATKS